jgi:hypothetical protein
MLRTIGHKTRRMSLVQQLDDEISILSSQILAADFRGYDPYDIFDRLARTPDSPSERLQRKLTVIANRTVPKLARGLLRIQPQLNPKALGLCLRAFALLYEQASAKEPWYAAAERALDLLTRSRNPDYPMPVWGYPFDWRSRVLIPRGTPSAVVNSIIADGFMEWFRVSGELRFLDMSRDICEFFVHELNRSPGKGANFCFSYTPIDHFHVHNANLFVAETLIKVGAAIGCSEWVELGQRAAAYTLADQREDGSLSYWATDQIEAGNLRIDHYHSGFEIRMLCRIGRMLHDAKFLSAARRYYDFYRKHLLHPVGNTIMPKYMPERIFPVDIHSCAELIILNSELAIDPTFLESFEVLTRGATWILANMRDVDGGFYSRIENCCFFQLHIKISYMRWGMAWMLLALSLCRLRLTDNLGKIYVKPIV